MGRLKGRRGRPSNYLKSLRHNPYWEKVKRKVKVRDRFCCVMCGANKPLEVHHITYKINAQRIVGNELEHLNWLVTLCQECHTDAHFLPGHPFNPKNPDKVDVYEFLRSK